MHREPFWLAKRSLVSRLPRQRGLARTFTVGVLAATLVATSAGPVFAKGPHQGRHGEPRQEQDASAIGRGKDGTREADVSSEARGKGGKNGRKNGGKNGARTVKKTFSNGDSIAIPAVGSADEIGPANPYPSTIAVNGFKQAKITDLNLTLRGFSHEFSEDVDVLLVAPGGRNAVVMGDVGGRDQFAGVTNLTITLDDEAAAPPSTADDVELTSGTFQPFDDFGLVDNPTPVPGVLDEFPSPAPTPSGSNALSTFDGINPNGQWRLFVLDDVAGDVGSFADGWTLEITAKSKNERKRNR